MLPGLGYRKTDHRLDQWEIIQSWKGRYALYEEVPLLPDLSAFLGDLGAAMCAVKASAPRPDGSLGDLGAAQPCRPAACCAALRPPDPMGLSGTSARPSRVGHAITWRRGKGKVGEN